VAAIISAVPEDFVAPAGAGTNEQSPDGAAANAVDRQANLAIA